MLFRQRVITATLLCAVVSSERITPAAEKFDAGNAIRVGASLIEQEHLRQWPLDDILSRRWLASLIQRLDPDGLLFLQADRDEFEKYADRLDDFAKEENLEFANLLRKRYQERWTEAAKLAEKQVVAKHDFTIDEEVPRRYEKAAADHAELAERWRKRIKLELLLEKIHGRPALEVEMQLSSRYERLRRQAAELSVEQWTAQYIRALIGCVDAGSYYYTEDEVGSYDYSRIRRFSLDMRFDIRQGKLVVHALPNHPLAWQQRLAGYQVLALRRLDGQTFDVVGMDTFEFSDLARLVSGPFAEDKAIILELLSPVTLERLSVKCSRYEIRRSS